LVRNVVMTLPGVKSTTEQGHMDHIKGFKNEMKVLRTFEQLSIKEKLGLKIFHDIEIEEGKLEALCAAFGCKATLDELHDKNEILSKFRKDSKGEFLNLEIDLVILHRCTVYLIEVKSSMEGKALNQLAKAEYAISLLFKIVSGSDQNISIQKIFAVPTHAIGSEQIQENRIEQADDTRYAQNEGKI